MAFRYGGALSRSMRSAFHSSSSPNSIRTSGVRSSSRGTTNASSSSTARTPLSPSPSPRRNPLGNDNASFRPRSASPSSPLSRLPAELGGVMSMLPQAAATLTSPFCLNCRSCTALSQGDTGAGDGG